MNDQERPAELTPAERAARRRRLAAIFGETLPDQTSDDAPGPEEGGGASSEAAKEAWLKRQVPPHHG